MIYGESNQTKKAESPVSVECLVTASTVSKPQKMMVMITEIEGGIKRTIRRV
jgi:hypothetical protein